MAAQDILDDLRALLDEARWLESTAAPARGWAGIFVEPVNRDLARRRGWPLASVWVVHVAADSPASKAGLKADDVWSPSTTSRSA